MMISSFFIDEIHTIVGAGGATGLLMLQICLTGISSGEFNVLVQQH
jgi:ATP-dependent Clp protease ATP-binding subunit ClpA